MCEEERKQRGDELACFVYFLLFIFVALLCACIYIRAHHSVSCIWQQWRGNTLQHKIMREREDACRVTGAVVCSVCMWDHIECVLGWKATGNFLNWKDKAQIELQWCSLHWEYERKKKYVQQNRTEKSVTNSWKKWKRWTEKLDEQGSCTKEASRYFCDPNSHFWG